MGSGGTVAVLGGGISGLAAAYRLTQITPTPKRIVLLEASSRLGGWVHSSRLEDGVVYEHGPRTIRPVGESGITTLNLVDELGMSDQVISVPYHHPSSLNRFIYSNSKLVRLPTNISAVFKAFPPFKRPFIAAGIQDLLTKKSPLTDEPIYDFINRRFGEDLAEFAIDPIVRGICAGDAREISVNFLLRSLKEYEQDYGRVTIGVLKKFFQKEKVDPKAPKLSQLAERAIKKERWPVWSLQGGLQSLPEALAVKAAKDGVELFVESACTGLEFRNDGSTIVKCGQEELQASRVVSALPSFKLAELVQPSHPDLASLLQSIESVTVGLVNLEWPGKKLDVEAFGFLVPSTQKLPILGVVYDTCSFPQGDRTILTVMMGGKWFKSLFGDKVTKEELLDVALKQLKSVLGISDPPIRSQVHILSQCIPQYVVGHYERVFETRRCIENHKLGLDLIGASYDGVSVNDCIHNAIRTVNQLTVKI